MTQDLDVSIQAGRGRGVSGLRCVSFVTANKWLTTRSPYVCVCVMNFSDVEERTSARVYAKCECVCVAVCVRYLHECRHLHMLPSC